ncbi:ribosome-associated translation inhibitor RaiA [Candidatus Dojkabacteria bacterium]|jgi:ribosomal subunit interface protein|nr:ribosome-associated translation inhibitor RaiA [Candidatus Dojkabacteria bacterium]
MNIQFSFLGMNSSNALRDFTTEKVSKYEHLLTEATKISIDFKKNTATKGVENDFNVDINVVLPSSLIRVQESGKDMYAIVDKLVDVLGRRLKKYHEKKNVSETEKDILPEEEIEEDDKDEYIDYAPKVGKRVTILDIKPLNESEAIEKMELSGRNQILFKDISIGLVSMIYKNKDNEYILESLKKEI